MIHLSRLPCVQGVVIDVLLFYLLLYVMLKTADVNCGKRHRDVQAYDMEIIFFPKSHAILSNFAHKEL